ncbi:MAG: tyrosine-protein phosphatase [Candidatus Omnitrophica bacterium]|nr:tyrosine-protein phosphatase [Candidatus Omnitrophota bacterium]
MFKKAFSISSIVATCFFVMAISIPAFSQLQSKDSVSQIIDNFGSPGKGFYRGAQPSDIALKALKELGVKTIVDFRNEPKKIRKEQQTVESLGMRFVSIPWDGRREPRKADVQQFIELLKDSSNNPVFFHCRRGAERTGVMWASYRVAVDGWDPDKASEEMLKYQFRSFWFPHLTRFLYDFSRDYGFQKEYTTSRFVKAKEWLLTHIIYSPVTKRVNA